ncbi:MAG: ATP-dependent DNA helicase RecG [Thermoleophilia bacterium]
MAELPGVGRVTVRRFRDLGVTTVGDLLLHVPYRHEPPARVVSVAALRAGEEATIRVRVQSCAVKTTRKRGLKVLEALVADETAMVRAVWYNQEYLVAAFAERPEILARGTLIQRGGATSFVVKTHEIVGAGSEGLHTVGLVPMYPASGDLSVKTIRTVLGKAAPYARHFVDPLPSALRAARGCLSKADALLAYHFPAALPDARAARERLAFEELLLLQLALLLRRREAQAERSAEPLPSPGALTAAYIDSLPFTPTAAQRRVMSEIDGDLARPVPMRRLLQGDVGSGKTMVAAYALVRAVEAGGQGAVMVPTEVLADQHAARLRAQLAPLGIETRLLKGNQPAADRRDTRDGLASGRVGVVVGTHALIQQGVTFRELRVAVVDEQHRFGVRQRDALVEPPPGRPWPHTLHMTATPIPRTLSLTLYGDLDVSVIDELPPGRTPVQTRLVFPEYRRAMWALVRKELAAGRQAYVVCPLVEESETLQAAAATAVFEELRAGELAGFRVELLHGQLPPAEKQAAMDAFQRGEAAVLVCTTVIEVGVDVPNASIMVIEGARRFGLSQLHQLRGRVGRGAAASRCLLLCDHDDPDALSRLALFARTGDGFKLAEADLRARGEGQLFGERQSGLGDLRVARLLQDRRLLYAARREAVRLLEGDPDLSGPVCLLLAEAVEERFAEVAHWLDKA